MVILTWFLWYRLSNASLFAGLRIWIPASHLRMWSALSWPQQSSKRSFDQGMSAWCRCCWSRRLCNHRGRSLCALHCWRWLPSFRSDTSSISYHHCQQFDPGLLCSPSPCCGRHLGTSFRSLPLRSRRGLLLIRLARRPCLASRYLPLPLDVAVVVSVIVIDQ